MFPFLKVLKMIASLLLDFLKELVGEHATLKLSAIPSLAGGVMIVLPVALINAIASG